MKNWDYDKLFEAGNVVGVKSVNNDSCNTMTCLPHDVGPDWTVFYKNNGLSHGAGEIQWIIKLDNHGNVIERVFDREKDFPKPMPKIQDGMFVHISNLTYDSDIGVVIGDKIVYQTGGFDVLHEVVEDIDKIWKSDYGFDIVNDGRACLIWSRN